MTSEIVDELAAEIHKFWMEWSKAIAKEESISTKRYIRWQRCWVPYEKLPKDMKDVSREYARRILRVLGHDF